MIQRHCIAVFAALAVLASCQSYSDFGVHSVQPRDIPVPLGMQLDTHLHRSDSVEVGEYRYANLVYRGSMPTMQIGDYLRNRMPQHSYELTSQERTDEDTEQYTFQRGPYIAICTVRRIDGRSELAIRLRTNPQL